MRNNKILRKKYLLLPLCFFFLLLHICMISVYAGQENSTSGPELSAPSAVLMRLKPDSSYMPRIKILAEVRQVSQRL